MSATKGVLALCMIFYLANQAFSLKCYHCASLSHDECWKNPKKSEYEQSCSGSRSVNSDPTLSNLKGSSSQSALANIFALISEVSIAPRAITDSQCLKLTGSTGQIEVVMRTCITKEVTDEQLKAAVSAEGLTGITISRCDSNLCNSSSTFSINFLSLLSSLLLIFSIKL